MKQVSHIVVRMPFAFIYPVLNKIESFDMAIFIALSLLCFFMHINMNNPYLTTRNWFCDSVSLCVTPLFRFCNIKHMNRRDLNRIHFKIFSHCVCVCVWISHISSLERYLLFCLLLMNKSLFTQSLSLSFSFSPFLSTFCRSVDFGINIKWI